MKLFYQQISRRRPGVELPALRHGDAQLAGNGRTWVQRRNTRTPRLLPTTRPQHRQHLNCASQLWYLRPPSAAPPSVGRPQFPPGAASCATVSTFYMGRQGTSPGVTREQRSTGQRLASNFSKTDPSLGHRHRPSGPRNDLSESGYLTRKLLQSSGSRSNHRVPPGA